jgi:dethiobiotin synthetase
VIRVGVTGTDTGVGKTLVALALVGAARARGLRVAAMKPVETGVGTGPTDGERLAQATGGVPSDVSPYRLSDPLAPLVAARRAGTMIDDAVLDRAFERLSRERDVVVVEGAGGLLVPLAPRVTSADLFARWGLEVVLVAANRLGALNHVLLTVHAANRAGLTVRCIVLNTLDSREPDLAQATNAATLAELLPDIPVLSWPWLREPSGASLGELAERSGLAAVLDDRASPLAAAHLERGT